MIILSIAALLIIAVIALAVFARPKKKIWRVVCLLPVTALIAGIAFFAGMLFNEIPTTEENALYALRKTGLRFDEPGYFSLHGAWGWRDFFEVTEFVVPYETNRNSLLDEISNTEGWHTEDIVYEEYISFCESALWGDYEYRLLPHDIVFEAWYYCETSETSDNYGYTCEGAFAEIGRLGRGFDFAVYDADTGLFIYIHQFG